MSCGSGEDGAGPAQGRADGGAPPDSGAGLDAESGADGAGVDGGAGPACDALGPLVEPTEQLYVAPGGSDSASGAMGAPLATLAEAAKRFPSGGTVIVRGGTYGPQRLSAVGRPDHPLVIRAADGEVPVFDGASVQAAWSGVIALTRAEEVVLRGLEIKGCAADSCAGVTSPPVAGLWLRQCHIHHVDGPAARFAGKRIRIEGNHFHDVALTNENNVKYPDGGWPTCTGTTPDRGAPSSPQADDVIIRGNRIENCWGEGIGVWFAKNAVIEGNIVDNPFNVGIYMDNSAAITIARNFVRVSRGMHGGTGSGVTMGTEPYASWGLAPSPSRDITVTNNVIVAGGGVGWWSSSDTSQANTYDRVRVLHNTVIATSRGALGFSAVGGGRPAPTACAARNNVFAQAGGSGLGGASAWTLASNAWLNGAKPPVTAPSDVTIAAALGTVGAAADVAALAASVGAGEAGTGVTLDFACKARSPGAPTRGAFER